MIRFIFAVSVLLSAGTVNASCLPTAQPVTAYLAKHPAWHIVNMSDLGPDDTDLWRKYRGNACPGQAQADLKGNGQISYGLVLLSKEGLRAVILLDDNGQYTPQILFSDKDDLEVVHTAEPGPAYEFETNRRVDIPHQSFVFEHLESSATHYYWNNGKVESVTISD